MAHSGRDDGVHVRAQLHRHPQAGQGGAVKQAVGGEQYGAVADLHLDAAAVGPGKGAVVHILPGDKGQQLPGGDDGGAAVKPAAGSKGQAHENQHVGALGGLHHPEQGLLCPFKEHLVADQVIAGAAGEGKLRKHQNLYALSRCVPDTFDHPVRVVFRVGHLDHRGGGGDFDKSIFHFQSPFRKFFLSLKIKT